MKRRNDLEEWLSALITNSHLSALEYESIGDFLQLGWNYSLSQISPQEYQHLIRKNKIGSSSPKGGGGGDSLHEHKIMLTVSNSSKPLYAHNKLSNNTTTVINTSTTTTTGGGGGNMRSLSKSDSSSMTSPTSPKQTQNTTNKETNPILQSINSMNENLKKQQNEEELDGGDDEIDHLSAPNKSDPNFSPLISPQHSIEIDPCDMLIDRLVFYFLFFFQQHFYLV